MKFGLNILIIEISPGRLKKTILFFDILDLLIFPWRFIKNIIILINQNLLKKLDLIWVVQNNLWVIPELQLPFLAV